LARRFPSKKDSSVDDATADFAPRVAGISRSETPLLTQSVLFT
jgi:hypothetical protein